MSSGCPQRPAGMRSRIARDRDRVLTQRPGVVGGDVARRDGVDIDAGRRPFIRQRLRHAGDRVLGRGVGATLMPPWKLSRDAVKMIFPFPRAAIPAPMACASRNGAVRLTSSRPSQASSRMFGGRRPVDGARVVYQDVDRPLEFARCGRAGPRTSSRSARSAGIAQKRRPWASTRRRASPPSGSSAALTPTTSAPAQASASAMASPIPRRAPVTTASRPASENGDGLLAAGGRSLARPAIDQHLHHLRARLKRRERLGRAIERLDRRDQLRRRDRASGQQLTARSKSRRS